MRPWICRGIKDAQPCRAELGVIRDGEGAPVVINLNAILTLELNQRGCAIVCVRCHHRREWQPDPKAKRCATETMR